MKKTSILCLVLSALCFLPAHAYTQNDILNASFLADRGIITFQTSTVSYRLNNTITRAELVGIALKVKGISVSESYQCKGYFTDISAGTWVCRAVEKAADLGLITRQNANFRPQDTVTRAEALAILMKAG